MSESLAARVDVAGEHLSASTMQALGHLLAESAGLQADRMADATLRRALVRRMRAMRETRGERYLMRAQADATERTALLEQVLVHETCFFRDRAVFAHLRQWCVAWFALHPAQTMRILSAPCSTGEEAYSVAATLWEAGVAPERFHIDAVDIAPVAVRATRAAVYSGFSLRNIPAPERESFLLPASAGWRVVPELRATVSAWTGDLLQPQTLQKQTLQSHTLQQQDSPQATYDLILCRNLLLYLHADARRRVLANLRNVLAAEGRLILGSADWSPDVEQVFSLEQPTESFAARPMSTAEQSGEAELYIDQLRVHATATGEALQPSVAAAEKPAAASRRPTDTDAVAEALFQRAQRAQWAGLRHEAVRLARQAQYLCPDHLPSLQLLHQSWEGASQRVRQALASRLQRLREEAP